MFKFRKLDKKILVLIFLPLVLAAASLTFSTFTMLDKIATSVNKQERLRNIQSAQAALTTVQASLEAVVSDNALWDDAVNSAYEPYNEAWLIDNWSAASSDSAYDAVFIVDSTGKSIFGFRQGNRLKLSAQDYLGSVIPSSLSAMPHDNSTFKTVTSLVKTPNGLAAMAVAPILPFTKDMRVGFSKPNYLIFLKTISDDVIAELAQTFLLKDLKFGPPNTEEDGGMVAPTRWGQPVAKFYWTENNPGKAARDASSVSAWLNISALLLVLLPLAFVHFRTIAKIDNSEKEAHQSARRDALSKLPNRVLLIEEINRKLPDCLSPDGELAMAFIDLDGFKAVNDAYGHDIGDQLIQVVANGLQGLAADNMTVARLGGDEFAVICAGRDSLTQIEKLSEQILALVSEPFDLQGRIVGIGASIGIAQCIDPKMDVSEFMRQADIAMYDAKETGRNRWRKFNPTLDIERSEELSIVSEMRLILNQDQMEVAYQPFVCSRDRIIMGVEALARWPSNAARKIGPDRFVALAEQHGLIDKLGMTILRKACRDMASWRDLKVAVNFSPLQIRRLSLVKDIKEVAAEFDFDLNRLEVEFTESVLIQNPERAKQVIAELQALGITVALDDFGTGYASVGYLHRFAFDKIKLDRSLTQSLSRGTMTNNIVQGTVLIAKGLSADVIAEGVETEEDANLMRLAGCELLQGYHFGKPQGLAVLNDLLEGHPKRNLSVSA